MVTEEYGEACVEVLGILYELVDEDYNKIPSEIIKFLEDSKSKFYKPDIDFSSPIEEINLKQKSREILTSIYLHYLCPESNKEELLKKIELNSEKKQAELRKKYNTNDIFKNKNIKKKEINYNQQ